MESRGISQSLSVETPSERPNGTAVQGEDRRQPPPSAADLSAAQPPSTAEPPFSSALDERLIALEARLSRTQFLENRVQELETKLSVLSRVLQLQNKNNVQAPSTPLPPAIEGRQSTLSPSTPSPLLGTPPQTPRHENAHSVPVLESPASFLGKDRDSAQMYWRKEVNLDAASEMPKLSDERPPTTHSIQTLFEGVPATQSTSVFSPPFQDHSNHRHTSRTPLTSNKDAAKLTPSAFQLPESVMAPKNDGITASKRNLSFRLLYEGDEKAYKRGKQEQHLPADQSPSTPQSSSMTLADRRWLGSLAQSINGVRSQGPDDNVRTKWLNYLNNSFQESTADVDVQMEEFIKVPGKVEAIMGFGFYICVDSFLYCITVLPIRFVWSCLLLANRLVWGKQNASPAFTFHRRHSYQMIQVFILYVIHTYVLAPISIGQLYHWIRGQAMIKLYVLIAIVEVFDRLMCSMGQDCLDSMYWNTVNRPTSTRMIISVTVVLVYCTIHTLLLFVHVATLNVAMNSADQALLALLISGNFAEIKSTVFKKYNRPALFKLTASDICERFKLGLFLGLVLLLNYCQGMERYQFIQFLRTCGLIWGGELLADWIKHSFITKFNFLPARVFVEYSLLLAGDVTGIGHEGVNVDNSHAVVKRIGFAQLPFVCVTFRMVREAAKYAALNEFWSSLSSTMLYGLFATSWLVLLTGKIALGSVLHQMSLNKLSAAPEMKFTPKKKKQ